MKDLCQYGNRPRTNGKSCPGYLTRVRPSKSRSRLRHSFSFPTTPMPLGFRTEVSAGIREFRSRKENNSGVDLFHFDSDEDVFCVYSQYIDDLMLLSKMIRAACDNEKTMGMYLNMSEVAKA